MSVLSDLLAQFGGLSGAAKQGQSGVLEGLMNPAGGAPSIPGETNSTINPAVQQSGALAQMGGQAPQEQGWLDRNSDALSKFGDMASRWGAGVSAASDFSREPISFSGAMAGGQQALDDNATRQLDNRVKEAQIAKAGNIDYNDEAQRLLEKQFSGAELSPEETARLQAINSFRQTVGGTQTDAFGRPMARPSLLDGTGVSPLPQQSITAPQGIAPGAPGGQTQRGGLEKFSPEQVAEYKRMRGIR